VVYGLLAEGAAEVEVWNRTPARARELVEQLSLHAGSAGLRAVPEPALEGHDLLVNATTVGMAEGGNRASGPEDFKLLHISADKLTDVPVVGDLVYREGGTPLLREAKARGSRLVDGIDILAHQGAASFELWTGRKAPLEVMRLAARTRQDDGAA
jgi:shikimate dehydrogenase